MISLVDPSDLENVLRPTVYNPGVITRSEATRDLAVSASNGEIPRFARDDDADIRKTRPDQIADLPRY